MNPGGGLSMGGKRTPGPEVGVSEFLQKLRGPSLGDAGSAVDDQVLVQAHGVALVGFDGQRDPGVVADVAYLAVLGKMPCHDLIAVQAHRRREGRGVSPSAAGRALARP